MQTINSAFVGRITTNRDARNAAYRVKLYADDTHIRIVGVDGDEWSWNMDAATVTQISVDRFHLALGGEDLFFLPVDTRGFIARVVQPLSDTPVEPHRGWLRRRIEAAQASGVGDDSGYDLEVDVEAEEETGVGRRRHVHEWADGRAAGVLTRRCVGCGQVSIDATGLKSTLEAALLSA